MVYIPYSECSTRLQYYWPWQTAFIFIEKSWKLGETYLRCSGEWKYSGVLLWAVSQGISPAQWEMSHFVALLEETEEKESERIWQGYAVNCFFAGGFVFTRSLPPPLLFSFRHKDLQKEEAWRKDLSPPCTCPLKPAKQRQIQQFFSTGVHGCSVVANPRRNVSFISAIEPWWASCCLLRM